jgi:hypothetical protein
MVSSLTIASTDFTQPDGNWPQFKAEAASYELTILDQNASMPRAKGSFGRTEVGQANSDHERVAARLWLAQVSGANRTSLSSVGAEPSSSISFFAA